MAAIDFPASPTTGQTFVAPNGVLYSFNGSIWVVGEQLVTQPATFTMVQPASITYNVAGVAVTVAELTGIGVAGEKYFVRGGLSGSDNAGAIWWHCRIEMNRSTFGKIMTIRHWGTSTGMYMGATPVIFTLTGPASFQLVVWSDASTNWTVHDGAYVSAQRVTQ